MNDQEKAIAYVYPKRLLTAERTDKVSLTFRSINMLLSQREVRDGKTLVEFSKKLRVYVSKKKESSSVT